MHISVVTLENAIKVDWITAYCWKGLILPGFDIIRRYSTTAPTQNFFFNHLMIFESSAWFRTDQGKKTGTYQIPCKLWSLQTKPSTVDSRHIVVQYNTLLPSAQNKFECKTSVTLQTHERHVHSPHGRAIGAFPEFFYLEKSDRGISWAYCIHENRVQSDYILL